VADSPKATIKAAYIAGAFAVLGIIITGLFGLHKDGKPQANQPQQTILVQPNIPVTVNNSISTETPSKKPEQSALGTSLPSKPVQQTPSQPETRSPAPDDIDVEMITTLITKYFSAINTLYTTGDAGAIMPLLKDNYDQSSDQVFVTKLMLEQSFKDSPPQPTSIRLISCKIVSFTSDKAMVEVQSIKTFRAADAQSAPAPSNTLKIVVQKIDDHWLILQG
jgi:hypothetical protein